MENYRSKMTQGGEEDKKPKIAKLEASDAKEQASPLSLRSLQEKIDRNTRETSTQVSQILQKLESIDKELAAAKTRNNLTREMLQIDVLDNMKDAIGALKNDVGVVTGDLQTSRDNTLGLLYELWVLKDNVKIVTQNFLEFQQKEDLQDETLENHMLDVREEMREVSDKVRDLEFRREELSEAQVQIPELWDEMYVVREKVDYLEKQGAEVVDVEPALESLKDELNNVKNELKSVKDVGKDVVCELNNVKEELRVVEEKTRGTNVGQKEMVGVPEVLLYLLQKVTNEVSCVKHDLRDIGVGVSNELAMGVGGRLRNVRRELKSIRHEMRAAKHEQRELTNVDLNLIKEFNDTIRSAQIDSVPDHAQNVKPTVDDSRDTFREVMTKVINKKKRKQDSRHPTLNLNKRLRNQSNDRDEHDAAASVPSASAV